MPNNRPNAIKSDVFFLSFKWLNVKLHTQIYGYGLLFDMNVSSTKWLGVRTLFLN